VTTSFGYTTAGTRKRFQNPGRAVAVGIDQGNHGGRYDPGARPKPAGIPAQDRGSPKPTHHRKMGQPMSLSAQTTGILFDTSSKKPNPIIAELQRTHHITMPRSARRGVHRRMWKGVSQASGAVRSNWSVSKICRAFYSQRWGFIALLRPDQRETWTPPKGGKQIPVTSLPLIFLEEEVIANCSPYLRRRRTGSKNGIIVDHYYYVVFREDISGLRCSQWHSSDSWGKWGLSKSGNRRQTCSEAHVLVAPPTEETRSGVPPQKPISLLLEHATEIQTPRPDLKA
jgi:hypothetical protein